MSEQKPKNGNVKLKIFIWVISIIFATIGTLFTLTRLNAGDISKLELSTEIKISTVKEEIVGKISEMELNIIKEIAPIKANLGIK